MDIKYTILGLLNWKPFSGYDLKKYIAGSELFFWSGNNNQIYTSLVELHKQGLVSQEIQPQEHLPTKKIYTITEAGREELHRWLRSDPELPEFRNNFLIQLAWMDELTGDELETLLARQAEEINIQLQMRYAQRERASVTPKRTAREEFLWTRIEEKLIRNYRYELEWTNQLREDLHNFRDRRTG
jgi:DNA-binding PadR family transcriptional regulator